MQPVKELNSSRPAACHLAEGFGLREKIWAQTSFMLMGILGTIGIARADWPWLLPYIFVFWYGVPGIMMRHLACPRCPHLHRYHDCLQAPPAITRWLVKRPTEQPFNRAQKVWFWFLMLAIPIYPLYWLIGQPVLLVMFLASALAWYGGQLLRFCSRCRVRSCPFRRVAAARG
ncbi:MAG: hypothetical protein KQH53_01815 [Desulfarculaceae bacterium]|nr:hypothetical protein [Desulfarculaceae bacterium]